MSGELKTFFNHGGYRGPFACVRPEEFRRWAERVQLPTCGSWRESQCFEASDMAPPPLALTRETPRLRALLKTDEHFSARYRAGTRADRPRIKEVIEYVREQLQMPTS
jgi:hypothetical protein